MRMTNANGRTSRLHVQATARALDDLQVVLRHTSMTTSASVCAALRCYRAMLEHGLVAESGELLHGNPRNGATGTGNGTATSGA